MRILFVHQNYPGQYREILPRLCTTATASTTAPSVFPPGPHDIHFLTQREKIHPPVGHKVHRYKRGDLPADKHPYTSWFQTCIANAIGAARAASTLHKQGFTPDVIVGHAGWGELLFLKEVWPNTPILGYFEYYFLAKGGMIGFDPEFRESPDIAARVLARNAPNHLSEQVCDAGYTASTWQKQTYPSSFQPKISVFHEGIRTDTLLPEHTAKLTVKNGDKLFDRDTELITYIARNLEPSRGFHTMMRALPDLQSRRPNAQIAIIGGDGISYGGRLANGQTFRDKMTAELGDQVDWSKVHFLGQIPYPTLIDLIKLSRCHVYLTTPFVVSWSMLEAMALEKTIVASDVAPVRQYITDCQNGFLIDFFSPAAIAEKIADVLAHPDHHREIGEQARRTVVSKYDFATVCYPQFLNRLAETLSIRP